jgi:hypothetical protein
MGAWYIYCAPTFFVNRTYMKKKYIFSLIVYIFVGVVVALWLVWGNSAFVAPWQQSGGASGVFGSWAVFVGVVIFSMVFWPVVAVATLLA